MKRLFGVLAASALLFLAAPTRANASTISFTLNCVITATTGCGTPGSYGSIVLTDNGFNIDVVATLTVAGATIRQVSLNWGGPGAVPTDFVASGGNIGTNTIAVGNNNQDPFGRFDLFLTDTSLCPPATGPCSNPLSFTLSSAAFGDLDTAYFNVRDDVNQTLGSLATPQKTFYAAAVPEPATLGLLGLGLLTIGARLRGRRS